MKILVCGDSWSEAWDVTYPWHSYLDCNVVNVAKSGSTNEEICDQFLKNYNDSFDLTVIGWSGVTRFSRNTVLPQHPNIHLNEFSLVDDETIQFFKNVSLNDILKHWENKIESVLLMSQAPVLHFSVFGDRPLKKYDNFLNISFLEYLANKQNIFFKYDIPIFEYDWLNQQNYKLTKKFGKQYFNKNWQRACVEREFVRPGKYFFSVRSSQSRRSQNLG